MDVVKTNIEKIGGTIDLQNRPGQGTTVRVRIPLTLAIIPALIVSGGGDRFAIPQVSLLELLSFEGDEARQVIEMIHDEPVYRLRGRLLPLVYLNRELQLEQQSVDLRPRCAACGCAQLPRIARSDWSSMRSTMPKRLSSSR